jgi:uncharacterized protein (DUF1330 family)
MPKGYWVTTYRSIKDPDKLAAYAKLAPVALAPFGAKYIVRSAAVAASEAGIKQRVVISVFDNVEDRSAQTCRPAVLLRRSRPPVRARTGLMQWSKEWLTRSPRRPARAASAARRGRAPSRS